MDFRILTFQECFPGKKINLRLENHQDFLPAEIISIHKNNRIFVKWENGFSVKTDVKYFTTNDLTLINKPVETTNEQTNYLKLIYEELKKHNDRLAKKDIEAKIHRDFLNTLD